jgi:hypothetical protein
MRNQQDFYSGLLFIVVGSLFAWGAGSHDIGSASDMGPGYYPRLLGILSILIGTIVIAKSFIFSSDEDGRVGPWAWPQLILIISANLVFGAMIGGLPSINIPPMGLVLAVYLLVFIASVASGEFKVKEYIVLSTVLVVGVYAICVKVLNLYVPLWPSIIAG